jgi:4-amino-4-deoxy-L-arabinose transferase-like glycosyltransferase
MESKAPIKPASIWAKPAPITLLGVVILGIVGSTLYDLIVKPGLTGVGRLVLNVLTLGSQRLLDSVYAAASLDPTPVTGLLLLQGALLAASLPAVSMFSRRMVERDKERIEERTKDLKADDQQALLKGERDRLKKRLNKLRSLFWLIFLPWLVMAVVAFALHNQSILVWRVFQANLQAIGPVATPQEIAKFRSEFALMNSKADYLAIMEQMTKVARERHAKLIETETW